jgi:hypothetical protein
MKFPIMEATASNTELPVVRQTQFATSMIYSVVLTVCCVAYAARSSPGGPAFLERVKSCRPMLSP